MSVQYDEFELIARFRAPFPESDRRTLPLGPGDDAALLAVPPGQLLAITTDTLVGGRHFPVVMPAAAVGWRALAVNLSDLAAMGAQPYVFQVALTLPWADGEWLAACGQGMARLAAEAGAMLSGGNISRGELALTITALGFVPEAQALRRSGGQAGDGIYVSGQIGLAAAGLARALRLAAHEWPDLPACLSGGAGADLGRYATPVPRNALGIALRGVASAALDISDGLFADLGHLCLASGVGAHLHSSAIPVPVGADVLAAATAGDDYELCFTVPPMREPMLAEIAQRSALPLTRIGEVVAGSGISIDGESSHAHGGYRHF